MKEEAKKLAAFILMLAFTVSSTGCMHAAKQSASTPEGADGIGSQAGKSVVETPDGEPEIDGKTPITLRMNWWGGDSRHQKTLEAMDAYQEKYPNVTVVPEYEAFNGHEEKVALGIQSGNAADVMQLDWSWIATYSPQGDRFYDLNKVSGILDLDNYSDEDKEVFTIYGKLNAVPISKTGRVFCWNKTTFDKVGVGLPETLEELLAAGGAFAAFDDSYYPLVAKELDRAFLLVYYLQCQYGKNWVEDGKAQYTQGEIAEGFDFLKELEDHHVIPTLQKVAGDGADLIDTNPNWINGHYAGIFLYDTSVVKHAEAVKGGEFVIGDYVKMGEYHGGFIKVSQAFGMSANTKHPAEAAALIQFMAADKAGVEILGDSRGVPANKQGLSMLDLSTSQVAQANAKAIEWCKFSMDVTFERNSFTGEDGTFYNALQLSSYGKSDSSSCAKIVLDSLQ